MAGFQPLQPLCAPGGAIATVPVGASDETIEKALARVLYLRMAHIAQASSPDLVELAEELARFLMRYANDCGKRHGLREVASPRLLVGPSQAECAAFEEFMRECRFVRTSNQVGKGATYQKLKIFVGRIWSILYDQEAAWQREKANPTNAATGPRG